jgi:hypothetical protein
MLSGVLQECYIVAAEGLVYCFLLHVLYCTRFVALDRWTCIRMEGGDAQGDLTWRCGVGS